MGLKNKGALLQLLPYATLQFHNTKQQLLLHTTVSVCLNFFKSFSDHPFLSPKQPNFKCTRINSIVFLTLVSSALIPLYSLHSKFCARPLLDTIQITIKQALNAHWMESAGQGFTFILKSTNFRQGKICVCKKKGIFRDFCKHVCVSRVLV